MPTGQADMEKGTGSENSGDQSPSKDPPSSDAAMTTNQPHPSTASLGKRACALAAYKNKVKDGKRAIVRLKLQKNSQLNVITSELLLLEARLRQEQKEILNQVVHKDATIANQKQEIERLRRENKRLIARLKKMSESRADEQKGTYSRTRSDSDSRVKSPKSNSKSPAKNSGIKSSLTNHEISSLTSQFYDVHCSSSVTSAGEERIFHKPPIAEKPKLAATRILLRAKAMEEKERLDNSQCNIVSTISRLLEEESDRGIAVSSGGGGEPSSPESTLKPTTPRVIKIARQFEKGFSKSGSHTCQDRKKDYHKAFVMDEHEVTSGYNSETFSEQEHDYENVLVSSKLHSKDFVPHSSGSHLRRDGDGDYEVLAPYDGDTTLVEEDPHTYSNVEFGGGEVKRNPTSADDMPAAYFGAPSSVPSWNSPTTAISSGLLETNLDMSDTGSESTLSDSPRSAKNVPRSRDNINLIMNSEDGNHIMQDFEEFSLDSLDLDDYDDEHFLGKENLPLCEMRRCGDGAEDKTNEENRSGAQVDSAAQWFPTTSGGIIIPSQGGYEKFLEATGLSQKSILTPSRMFSNHRSVLKPRDIKHRDKLRAVFTTAMCIPEENSATVTVTNASSSSEATVPSPSQRYWREPFL